MNMCIVLMVCGIVGWSTPSHLYVICTCTLYIVHVLMVICTCTLYIVHVLMVICTCTLYIVHVLMVICTCTFISSLCGNSMY